MKTWLFLGAAALAVASLFLLRPDRASRAAPGPVPAANVADTPGPRAAPRPAGAPPDETPPPRPRPRPEPTDAERAVVRTAAEALVDRLRDAAALRRDEEDADEARDRAEAARERLLELYERHPGLALDLLAAMDRIEEAVVVRQLGQTLRFVKSDELVAALRRRAREGSRPADRRAALLGLEARAWTAWADVASDAYAHDDAPRVRDTAGAVLGRALLDRRLQARHGELRDTIAAGLASSDARDRMRALDVLLHDRWNGHAATQLAAPLTRDEDPQVRAAAERVLRSFPRDG